MQEPRQPQDAVAACSDAERRRAQELARALTGAGREARTVTLWVRPASWPAQTLCAAAGVGASVVGVDQPAVGLAITGAALLLAVLEVSRRPLLRLLTGSRATQNVISPPPTRPGTRAVTLILSAATDDRRQSRTAALPVRLPAILIGSLALLTAALGLRVATSPGGWLDFVQLVPTLVLLAAIPLLLDEGLGAVVPGTATPDAVLELARRLDGAPPENLDVAVALTGAGSAQAAGLRAWLRDRRRRGLQPSDFAVLHIEPHAGEGPVWWERDGTVVGHRLHPQLVAAARRAAAAGAPGAHAVSGTGTTAAGIAIADGWPAIAAGPDVDFAEALVRELDAEVGDRA